LARGFGFAESVSRGAGGAARDAHAEAISPRSSLDGDVNDVGGTEKQRERAVERLDVDVMRPGTLRSEVDLQLQGPAHLDGE
jgi:hypothetical protein